MSRRNGVCITPKHDAASTLNYAWGVLRELAEWVCDEFKDHPMRKDYVEPDDYEYEPTPHDEVLERAMQHQAQTCGAGNNSEPAGG